MRFGTSVELGLLDIAARASLLVGVVCAFFVSRSPWWLIGAVVLLPAGVWLTIVQSRARRNAQADEALDAAAEYDRTHPDQTPGPTA